MPNYMVTEDYIIKSRCGINGATNNYQYPFSTNSPALYTIIVDGMHNNTHYSYREYLYNSERNVLFLVKEQQAGNVNLTISISGDTMTITNSGSYGAQYEVLIF